MSSARSSPWSRRSDDALRLGLAMGADSATRVWDEALVGVDGAQSPRARCGRPLGRLRPDPRWAHRDRRRHGRSPTAARRTARTPQANAVTELLVEGGSARARREVEGGSQVVQLRLPAPVTTETCLDESRYPAIPATMRHAACRSRRPRRPTLAGTQQRSPAPARASTAGVRRRGVRDESSRRPRPRTPPVSWRACCAMSEVPVKGSDMAPASSCIARPRTARFAGLRRSRHAVPCCRRRLGQPLVALVVGDAGPDEFRAVGMGGRQGRACRQPAAD